MAAPNATSFPFNPQKATEVAARFINLSKGRSINIMKLIKLIYLLDRESIARRGVPVVGGVYLSMRNGPVTSELLDLINSGFLWKCETNWSDFISHRSNHEVETFKDPGTDNLSEFEKELIEELFRQHEHRDQWALAECCHQICGEWLPLEKGREHISLSKLSEEVGRDPREVLENAAEQNFLDLVFAGK